MTFAACTSRFGSDTVFLLQSSALENNCGSIFYICSGEASIGKSDAYVEGGEGERVPMVVASGPVSDAGSAAPPRVKKQVRFEDVPAGDSISLDRILAPAPKRPASAREGPASRLGE